MESHEGGEGGGGGEQPLHKGLGETNSTGYASERKANGRPDSAAKLNRHTKFHGTYARRRLSREFRSVSRILEAVQKRALEI